MLARITQIARRCFSRLGASISSFFDDVDSVGSRIAIWLAVSFFMIFGLICLVGPVVFTSRTPSGDIIWSEIIVSWIFGSVSILAATFVFATATDLGDRLIVPLATDLWQRLTSIFQRPTSKALSDTLRLRQKPRLVIRRGFNHLGMLPIYCMGVPTFLGGLFFLKIALSNLMTPGDGVLAPALAALLMFPAGVLLLFWRHTFVLDRHRRKVVARRSMLFLFRKEKEYDWNQCTAVCVGELLPYWNTLSGRVAPWIVSYGTDNPPNPHRNDGRVVNFDVGIVCGKELICIGEFGLDWAAERLGRKVAAYMELPIKDPRDEGFNVDLRPKES